MDIDTRSELRVDLDVNVRGGRSLPGYLTKVSMPSLVSIAFDTPHKQ